MPQVQADGGEQQGERNGQGDDQRAANIAQEDEQNDRNQNDSLGQVVQHRAGGQMHQVAAVEKRDHLHARRKDVPVQFLDLVVNCVQCGVAIGALAQEFTPAAIFAAEKSVCSSFASESIASSMCASRISVWVRSARNRFACRRFAEYMLAPARFAVVSVAPCRFAKRPVRPFEISAAKHRTLRVRAHQIRFRRQDPIHLRRPQIRFAQIRPAKIRFRQAAAFQIRPPHPGICEQRVIAMRVTQINFVQTRAVGLNTLAGNASLVRSAHGDAFVGQIRIRTIPRRFERGRRPAPGISPSHIRSQRSVSRQAFDHSQRQQKQRQPNQQRYPACPQYVPQKLWRALFRPVARRCSTRFTIFGIPHAAALAAVNKTR